MIPLVLASQSPARRQILTASRIDPTVIVSEVDEEAIAAAFTGSVAELTSALAEAKARAVVDRLAAMSDTALPAPLKGSDVCVVLAGDSLLDHRGTAIGKPATADRTREIWAEIAGEWTTLHTGHALAVLERDPEGFALREVRTRSSATAVLIGSPAPEELEAYIATEEPFHVAGALTIDGYGGAFVQRLDGDHLTVLGLSLPVVRDLARDSGLFWPDFWSPRR